MEGMEESGLFEMKRGKGRAWWWLYAVSMQLGLLMIWLYRISHLPEAGEKGRWAWMAMFAAELWFGFYWILNLSVRWNPIYRYTFKDRLSLRFEDKLPRIDVFICTADPTIEPPIVVINTVLSVLAYNYPPKKLSVYLSDDGGSIITFYALLEASNFAKLWIPFCKKFDEQPMSPSLFFSKSSVQIHDQSFSEWAAMKKIYEEMESRIDAAMKLGDITEEIKAVHEGFAEWSSKTSSKDHQAIIKILIDGRDENARDSAGFAMPTIVYMAREKHPKYQHNFKAGALNALVYFPGLDGLGGTMFTGSCCFHRRDCLNGREYSKVSKIVMNGERQRIQEESISAIEERAKDLATCSYEENTQWGKQMGLKYGCPVEDVITGFSIKCRGWKSAYFIPKGEPFLGLAPTTLSQTLLQHKRWSEGNFQMLLSKYSPFFYGFGRTKLGLQMGYSVCSFWAASSIPTLIYVLIPSICLLNGIFLFPSVSSIWLLPFLFLIALSNAVNLWEFLHYGLTAKGWWNDTRIWLYRTTTSDLFALVDTILKLLGVADSAFVVTPKVADEEASERYEKEIMEFGSASLIFTILSTISIFNLFCFVGGIRKVVMDGGMEDLSSLFLQFLLCGCLVLINIPIFEASFFRSDEGCIPMRTTFSSVAIVIVAYFMPVFKEK